MAWITTTSFVVLIVSVYTTTVYAVDPIVKIVASSPDPIDEGLLEGKRGTDITMDCQIENKPEDMSVRWMKISFDGSTKPISVNLAASDNHKYSIENPYPFTFRLRIRNPQIVDDGQYICYISVSSHGQNRVEDKMVVLVKDPPQFISGQTTPDITVNEGDDVEMLCNATGRPPPLVMWSRYGGALLPVGQEKYFKPLMQVNNVRAEHRGRYRCDVSNVIGGETQKQTHLLNLKVKFKPKVSIEQKVVKQAPGYVIELICYGYANPLPQETDIYWTKDLAKISQSGGRFEVRTIEGAFDQITYELIINGVDADEDYGDYRCTFANEFGNSYKIITLEHTDVPQPSLKLGRVIGGAGVLQTCTATILLCLLILFLH